jgi:hypothetical protein
VKKDGLLECGATEDGDKDGDNEGVFVLEGRFVGLSEVYTEVGKIVEGLSVGLLVDGDGDGVGKNEGLFVADGQLVGISDGKKIGLLDGELVEGLLEGVVESVKLISHI